jgi:hypothetical protein
VPADRRADFVWSNIDPNGWLVFPTPPTVAQADELRARTQEVFGESLRHLTVAPEAERALRDTLARCRAEGAGAVVVLMPESSWFRKLLPPAGDQVVRSLAAALGRDFDVPVIDARDWCPDAEFCDGHHLIAAGAARFTERFGRDVLPSLSHR